ncbi:AraC family two component transcriptional regulator [Hydrogenispora ethanolica]|jgi:two-component system response regulator YesN|uniref:AraC family two component transcriptional regulator n=1 Tax=Hydrogenispora ethanolica TaxID=1082276 RepID=A0A4R1R9B6_HYDET|nr:helix-turn-helix domain-containing protein [Hydrogenispora ethanolica]TCL62275.1 AraC family two component transcriptional regulator [Hydrogenispora ethanolica]
MIKTLIADDDIEMLQGLEHIIPWEEHGFTIVGKADNGSEALILVEQSLPDLLITDITMPGLNGLELIRRAKMINPGLKSVLLTCHEDFHFAKTALELESEDYLVKYTLTDEELLRTLRKVSAKYQAEQSQKAERSLSLNKLLARDNFFMSLVHQTPADPEQMADAVRVLNIALPPGSFQIIGVFADNLETLPPGTEVHITNCIATLLQEQPERNFFRYAENSWMILSWTSPAPGARSQNDLDFAKLLQQQVLEASHVSVSVTFSSACPALAGLRQAVDEACALRESYFYSEPGALVCQAQTFSNVDPHDLYQRYQAALKEILETGPASRLREWMEQSLRSLEDAKYPPAIVKSLFRRMLVDMEAAAGRHSITFEGFHLAGDTLGRYRAVLSEVIRFFLERLEESRGGSRRKEIQRVIDYIDGHLGENIRCERMAKYVNMNSSYFSRLFKTEMGVSFSDYLIQRRMERASVLLANSESSIDEIAKTVGIENPSYFYRVYKKITGKTPGKVRNQSL